MQRQPPGARRVGRGIAVDGVPEHGMPEERQVDADLVRAAGPQLSLHECGSREPLDRAHHRVRRAAAGAGRQRGSPGSRSGAADPAVDDRLLGQRAASQRQVASLDGVRPELCLQKTGRCMGERKHEHARGVTVEAMDDVDPLVAPGSALELGGGAGEDRVVLALGGGVDQQAARLVDDEHIGIGMQDLDRQRAMRAHPSRQVGIVLDRVSGSQRRARVRDHGPVDQHMAELNLEFGVRIRRTQQVVNRAGKPSSRSLHRASLAPMKDHRVDSALPSG